MTTGAVERAHPASSCGQCLLIGAAAAGLVHAAFSLYWAFGGQWLLGTVGQWALDLRQGQPLVASTALTAVAALKAAGSVLPLLATLGRVRWPRLWRGLAWVGAPALILYGGANTVVGALVLAGGLRPEGGYDRQGMLGHAYLWDPMFLIWGLLLLSGLYATRTRGRLTRRRIGQQDTS